MISYNLEYRGYLMDLFQLGLILIPFDNLVFAPSRGWATVSPIIFFIYIFINIKNISFVLNLEKKALITAAFIAVYQVMLLCINGVAPGALIDGLQTLVLGISIYLSMVLRYNVYKKNINNDAEFLYKGYFISFIYGIIRLIGMYGYNGLLSVFEFIEKRPYPRLAFSFTEPSFISMHVIGVMFLVTYLISDEELRKKFLYLGFAFLAVSILFRSSTRCILDTGIFVFLLICYRSVKNKRKLIINLCLIIAIVCAAVYMVNSIPRLNNIFVNGIYSDPSGVSRYARIKGILYGFVEYPLKTFFGYGMGNMHVPFNAGYERIYEELQQHGAYMNEIIKMQNIQELDSLFCMPVKMISDFGLGIFVLALLSIIIKSHKKLDVFVVIMTLYLYIQFDSYAFYSIWILLYIIKYYRADIHGISYFKQLS